MSSPEMGGDKGKWVKFEGIGPEELLQRLGEDPANFEIMAYTPPEMMGVPTVIDADEFYDAFNNPTPEDIALCREAEEYYDKMEREGRNI